MPRHADPSLDLPAGWHLITPYGASVRLIGRYTRIEPLRTVTVKEASWRAYYLHRAMAKASAPWCKQYRTNGSPTSSVEDIIYRVRDHRVRTAPYKFVKNTYRLQINAQAWWMGRWVNIASPQTVNDADTRIDGYGEGGRNCRWGLLRTYAQAAQGYLQRERHRLAYVAPTHNYREALRLRAFQCKKPTDNARWVSIEVEYCSSHSTEDTGDAMAKAGLSKYVCVKGDSSINTTSDNRYAIECVVTARLAELPGVVQRVCAVIGELGGEVNNSCGLHVHLDCRNDKPEAVYKRLQRAQPLLFAAVPKSRRDNRYCRRNTELDYENFEGHDDDSRYRAINAMAFKRHKTIEIRLGQGSLDAARIVSWALLCADIGYAAHKTASEVPTLTTLAALQEHLTVGPRTITTLTRRIERYSPDTATSHGIGA